MQGFQFAPTSDESKASSFLYTSVHGIGFFMCEIEIVTVLQCTFCRRTFDFSSHQIAVL